MADSFVHPVLGQEAVCPDGLGRVLAFSDNFPNCWIQVGTYVASRDCKWAPENVRLVPITVSPTVKGRQEVVLYRLRQALEEFDNRVGDDTATLYRVVDAARKAINQF